MDCKKIGQLIYKLRKEKSMTQKQLADTMNISDKAISKWERGQGCPDVSLLPELAQILGVSIDGILSGEIIANELVGGNMNKLKFYVCPQCNNLITSIEDVEILCCSKKIEKLEARKVDEEHCLKVENVEDEFYITSNHEMKKEHYIAFAAYVRGDRVIMIRQYPEWNL